MKDLKDIALTYLQRGMCIIPIQRGGKKPLVKWKKYQTQLPTELDISRWFTVNSINMALVCGHRGVTVLDFDDLDRYAQWLRWCGKRGDLAHAVATTTYRVKTARGMHIYLRMVEVPRTRAIRDEGIDIKGKGGYVLVPPSVHPSGAVYEVMDAYAPVISIDALSDVLPPALLVKAEPPPKRYEIHMPAILSPDNLWQVADTPMQDVESAAAIIKNALRIESFFPAKCKPREHDRYWSALCPFHDDHDPSFWLDLDAQVCKCWAGCTPDGAMDVIGLYAKLNDLTNKDAFALLARMYVGQGR